MTNRRLGGHDLLLLAAGLTFYALIAVVPLLLLAVFLAGLVLGHGRIEDLAGELAHFAPEGLGFADRLVELVQAATALTWVAVLAGALLGLLPVLVLGAFLVVAVAARPVDARQVRHALPGPDGQS